MNILAIDTATEACSVALQYNERVITRFEICPQQHSQRLLPMVDDVLKEANVGLSDIELLAFGRGPGRFTGVRIATGMIQGLALGTGLKVAGVSTLEAMACENAIIAFDVGQTDYFVKNKKNGFLSKDGDIKQMANSIINFTLLKSSEQIELQKESRRIAIEQHNIENFSLELEDYFNHIS